MRAYSLRKNLQYMALSFVKPETVIGGMLRESSPWYGIVPFVILKLLYEFLYLWDHLKQRPVFFKVIPIADRSYHLWKSVLAPAIEVVDLLIFLGVIAMLARLYRYEELDVAKVVSFFMFTATIGLVAVAADTIYSLYPLALLLFAHPLVGVISLAYETEFIHRQAGITRRRSLALASPAWISYFGFRLLFFR